MRLAELLPRLPGAELEESAAAADTLVDGITHDSQQVKVNGIFAALPGQRHHGLEFLPQALAAGASAVLSDRTRPAGVAVPWITSGEPRRHMALAAWALAGDPQQQLRLLAVTGTNGKSTVVDLIGRMLAADGITAGTLGTMGYQLPGGGKRPSARTTPEATDLAPFLRRLVNGGATAAVMEVSSHALIQERVAGLRFEVAVWTNLSRDHLDFHGDMESYYAAKCRLFTPQYLTGGSRVLPVDDPWASRLLQQPCQAEIRQLTWGLEQGDVHAEGVTETIDGTSFLLCLEGDGERPIRLPLVGRHNLLNALAAAAAARAAGLGSAAIAAGLENARAVPGRLERVPVDLPFPVFVDYAHTPEGLRTVLTALRRVSDRRLLVVFGAGGDRDQGKRQPMGLAVGELADVAIVTSDNPRSEDPAAIAGEVAAGVAAAGANPEIVLDRRQAISLALDLADEGSLVLVAGKGHEQTQTIGEKVLPFLDHAVVSELAGSVPCA